MQNFITRNFMSERFNVAVESNDEMLVLLTEEEFDDLIVSSVYDSSF